MADPDYILFATIATAGSLSEAARRLNLSPAMVSKRLSRLEERLGARLMHRTTRRLALTGEGQVFLKDVEAIVAASAAAEDRVRHRPGDVKGELRITAPTSFGRMHVAPLLGAFLERYPRVALSINLSDGFTDMLSEPFDVAIRISRHIPAGLTAVRIAPNRRILCASPAYVERHGAPATLAQLSRHRLLAADGQLPWWLDGPTGRIAVNGTPAVATNSSEAVRELALSGVGIALRSLWDIGADFAEGRLVQLLPDHEGARDVEIHAVHAQGHLVSPAVSAFIADLLAAFAPWESAGLPTPGQDS